MVAVSIIVPVHNSAAYLDKCVQSCLSQTLSEVELILVDDASSDNSPQLISQYEKEYPGRVRGVFLSENIRQGGARNRGLEIAQGEYIAFVDSDDWIEPDFCAMLYGAAKESLADMAGEEALFIEYEDKQMLQKLAYHSAQLTDDDQLHRYMSGCGYFWNRIYQREWLLKHELYFPERLAFEDSYFNTMTALYAESVVTVDKGFYHYYQSLDSTVRSRNKPHLYDKIVIAERIWEDTKARGIYNDHRSEIDIKCISILANTLFYVCLGSFDQADPMQLEKIRSVLLKHQKHYRENPYYLELPRTQRWFLELNMLAPKLSIWSYRAKLHHWIGTAEAITGKIWKR